MFQDISYCRSETLNIRKEIVEIYSHMNENSIEKYSHTNKQSMQIKAAATLSWVILLISSPLNLTAVNGSLCQLILNTLMLLLWQITVVYCTLPPCLKTNWISNFHVSFQCSFVLFEVIRKWDLSWTVLWSFQFEHNKGWTLTGHLTNNQKTYITKMVTIFQQTNAVTVLVRKHY